MKTKENTTYIELINGLDSIYSDYGSSDIEFPDNIENCYGDYDVLSEDEAKELFEYNNGNVDSILDFLNSEE